MKLTRISIHTLMAAMIVVPLVYVLESSSEASPVRSSTFEPSLLLSGLPASPQFDKIRALRRPVIASYFVREHEDLWAICKRFKVDQFSVRSSSDLDNPFPAPGTLLKIPNRKGTAYSVRTPESLETIRNNFSRARGLGLAFDREVLDLNGYPMPDLRDPKKSFEKGTLLFLPDVLKETGLEMPFSARHLTSGWGKRRHPVLGITRAHKGRDLAMPYGTKVPVTRSGVVTYAGWMGGYGNLVEIRHALRDGHVRYTRYGHLSKIRVRVGQRVSLYQVIGEVGSSGISTGPHLHYEIRDESGNAPNPNSRAAY